MTSHNAVHDTVVKLQERVIKLEQANKALSLANQELIAANTELVTENEQLMAERAELCGRIEWLNSIFERISVGLWTSTMDGCIIEANPAFHSFVGYEDHHLHGVNFAEITHPDDLESEIGFFEQIITNRRRSYKVDKRYLTKNGREVWGRTHISVVIHRGGSLRVLIGITEDITEERRMNHMLKLNEERLNYVLEATEDGVWDWDLLHNIVYFSPRWHEMFGYDQKEIAPHIAVWRKLIHPDDVSQAFRLLRAHIKGETPYYESEQRIRTKSGEWRWGLARGKVVARQEDGKPLRMVGTHVDITRRKRAEQEVRESEERLHLVLQKMPILLDAFDEQGNMVFWNDECERVTGHPADEVLHNPNVIELFYPDPALRRRVMEQWYKLTNGQCETHRMEIEFPCRDGKIRTIEWSDVSKQSPIPGWMSWAVGVDVTDRRAAERALKSFYVLTENTPDGVKILDLDGTITYANPAIREISGFGDDLIGMSLTDCIEENDSSHPMEMLQQVKEHGSAQGMIFHRRLDGTAFPSHISLFLVEDDREDMHGIAAITRDLSEQHRQEQAMIELQQQVIEAQRASLRELSTPMIPLAEGVIALPLVGSIDTARAQQVMETLLQGVEHYRARSAIIDITGVPVVDTQVANVLLQTAKAVRLIGARVMITGIGPMMAQTFVSLGVDLQGITTCSTLQEGMKKALSKYNNSLSAKTH
jgi:PAS domain S-box-containing protein